MEPFPLHYSRHPRAEEPTDPVLRRVLEEIHNLGDKIDGHCGGLEQRVTEAKQCFEERLITLEMAHTKSKATRVELEKRLDGLRLEVGQANRLLERENLENIRDMADIFPSVDSRAGPPPSGYVF
jgi:hypothetical protein